MATATHPAVPGRTRPRPRLSDSRRHGAVLAAAVLGTAPAYMSDDMLNLAIASVARDLQASTTAVQWILNAYFIPLVALVLVAGSLGDVVGHRRVFTTGLALFSCGAVLCATAPHVALLIAGRAVQGMAAAMLLAAGLALVSVAHSGEGRNRALAHFIALTAAVPALGPFLSGALVDMLSWRWLFVVPLALPATAFLITRRLPETPRARSRRPDLRGSLALLLALSGISVALILAPVGTSPAVVVVAAVVGVVAAGWFIAVERHTPDPLLPFGLLRRRQFMGANVVWLVAAMTSWGGVFFLAVALQVNLGLRPITAGLVLTPIYLVMMVASPGAAALASRVGRRRVIVTGLGVYATGLWLLGSIQSVVGVWGPLAVFAVGMATFTAPLAAASLTALDDEDQGVASGMNNVMGQLAGLLAIVILPSLAGLSHASTFAGPAFTAAFPRALAAAAIIAALGIPVALLTLPPDGPVRRWTRTHRSRMEVRYEDPTTP